jgi:hypothetical protein
MSLGSWTNHFAPSAGTAWGFDDGGGDGFNAATYSGSQLSAARQLCRPPNPADSHMVQFIVTWFDSGGTAMIGYQGSITGDLLQDDASWTLQNGSSSSSNPADTSNNPPYLTPPTGAVYCVVSVNDFGPYDGSGNTTGDTSSFSPYESESLAYAETSACSAATPPDLSGYVHAGEVHFS